MLGLSPKKSKAWENLSLWEKNQSMRNVYKGVEKWKILEPDENSKESEKK